MKHSHNYTRTKILYLKTSNNHVHWIDPLKKNPDDVHKLDDPLPYKIYRSQIKLDVSIQFISVQNSTECVDFIF